MLIICEFCLAPPAGGFEWNCGGQLWPVGGMETCRSERHSTNCQEIVMFHFCMGQLQELEFHQFELKLSESMAAQLLYKALPE